MPKRMLIDAVHPEEMRVVIENNGRIEEFDFVTSAKKQIKGNIYLAKITRVEPSLQAAFVEYGGGKQGFLPFSEIHPDYYQIPISDRQRLMEEQEALEASDDAEHPEAESSNAAEPVENTDFSENAEYASPDFPPAALPEETASAALRHEPVIAEPYPSDQPAFEPPPPLAEPELPATDFAASTPDTEDARAMNAAEGEIEDRPVPSDVETLETEEEIARKTRKPSVFTRRYRIQEVIKRGQVLLVQVIKEERGNKGVSLTTFISLAGRYCVLMPNSPKDGGISRRISSSEDRRRLKEMVSELRLTKGMSVIIRTAGTDRTRAEIKRDFDYLVRLWETIREITLGSTAPALVYEEGDLIKRSIRDLYNSDIDDIVVEGENGYAQAKEFMKMLMPSHAPRVKHYAESVPLFYAYNIEDQLATMYDPQVKLKSGGYIIISPTEALISIDVNSGRSTGERNIEETATKTNIEAAWEIARQIRLRDLAGLLVIDFIDMLSVGNRKHVERVLRDALRQDRAKIQLGRISPFGLLEMSRQRLRPSLAETAMMVCPHCEGRGTIRSFASVSIQLMRALEKDAATGLYGELRLWVSRDTAMYLLNQKREILSRLEKQYQLRIVTQVNDNLAAGEFRIDRIKLSQGERNQRRRQPEEAKPVASMDSVAPSEEIAEEELPGQSDMEALPPSGNEPEVIGRPDDYGRPREGRGRRGRRGGRRSREDRGERTPRAQESEAGPEAAAESGEEETQSRPAREPREGGRGRRGGRRRWKEGERRDGRQGENGAGRQPELVSGGYNENAGASPAQTPAVQSFAPPAPPASPVLMSMSSGESPDGKQSQKKGWWRRIVES
jgi:ribonuclease E